MDQEPFGEPGKRRRSKGVPAPLNTHAGRATVGGSRQRERERFVRSLCHFKDDTPSSQTGHFALEILKGYEEKSCLKGRNLASGSPVLYNQVAEEGRDWCFSLPTCDASKGQIAEQVLQQARITGGVYMKKILTILMVVSVLGFVVGCSQPADDTSKPADTKTGTDAGTTPPATDAGAKTTG